MPCSYCGQWINTNGTSTLGDHMEYAGIREPDARDVIFPGCHWWWINFPCGVTDEREWGVVGFLRCEACQQPSDDISPEDAAMPPPWPLHHTEVELRFNVDRAAGRVHRATSPTDAEAPNCIVGGVPNWGRDTSPRQLSIGSALFYKAAAEASANGDAVKAEQPALVSQDERGGC